MVSDKAIRQAFYTKLNVASVTGGLAEGSASLFHHYAKLNAAFPYVIFHKQSGRPINAFSRNAYDSQLWLVKAVDRGGSSSAAEDIAKAFDDLLDYGSLTITGATTLAVLRESDLDFVETVDDQMYRHHGALYRVAVAT